MFQGILSCCSVDGFFTVSHFPLKKSLLKGFIRGSAPRMLILAKGRHGNDNTSPSHMFDESSNKQLRSWLCIKHVIFVFLYI